MKSPRISLIVALPAALLFACAVNAQQAAPQTASPESRPMQQTQPAMPTTTQSMPMQSGQCASGTDCNNSMRHGGMSRTAPKFSTLAGAKGYVTKADTSGHRWWTSHFSQCDSNHDGQLTRSEYNACRTQH